MFLRPATLSDTPFVAWTVLAAIGCEEPNDELLSSVTTMCSREDVLYSWKNAVVAEVDGVVAGCLISYNGADYRSMREVTFPLIAAASGNDFSSMEMETAEGEYYLDSMAVLPEFRGRGVATQLLRAGITRAYMLLVPRAAMVVSPENPRAQKLYESLGFRFERDMFLFGEDYRKMVKKLHYPNDYLENSKNQNLKK